MSSRSNFARYFTLLLLALWVSIWTGCKTETQQSVDHLEELPAPALPDFAPPEATKIPEGTGEATPTRSVEDRLEDLAEPDPDTDDEREAQQRGGARKARPQS